MEPGTVAMLQGLVANQGDAWTWMLEELHRFYEQGGATPFPVDALAGAGGSPLERAEAAFDAQPAARDHVGMCLDAAATIGRRTADLHAALARPTGDPAFSPEPLTEEGCRRMEAGMRERAALALSALKENLSRLPDDVVEVAGLVLSRRRDILRSFDGLPACGPGIVLSRVHGDYHLGQLLRVKSDYVILDFEGEPARPLAERRMKQSPLKDVAGMLRSFDYAAWSALLAYTARRAADVGRLLPWTRLWTSATEAAFLRAYRETAGDAAFIPPRAALASLLDAFMLDKALYELLYELNTRPAWVRIPLEGVLSLAAAGGQPEPGHPRGGV
jgi:maltose alpha-D-glucosyltransferase / alpha-amylase